MGLNADSKHSNAYHNHVLDKRKSTGTIGKVYDLIRDLTNRRGLRQEWDDIDGDIQDEIIEKWCKILESQSSEDNTSVQPEVMFTEADLEKAFYDGKRYGDHELELDTEGRETAFEVWLENYKK